MRFQRRRSFPNGDRRSSRHFVALLRFDLYGKFQWSSDDYPKGYDDNSPVNLAHLFRDDSTRLLIVHGTADDNVHFPEHDGDGPCIEQAREAVRHDGLSRPEPFDDARRYDTRPREKMLRYTLENL